MYVDDRDHGAAFLKLRRGGLVSVGHGIPTSFGSRREDRHETCKMILFHSALDMEVLLCAGIFLNLQLMSL